MLILRPCPDPQHLIWTPTQRLPLYHCLVQAGWGKMWRNFQEPFSLINSRTEAKFISFEWTDSFKGYFAAAAWGFCFTSEWLSQGFWFLVVFQNSFLLIFTKPISFDLFIPHFPTTLSTRTPLGSLSGYSFPNFRPKLNCIKFVHQVLTQVPHSVSSLLFWDFKYTNVCC